MIHHIFLLIIIFISSTISSSRLKYRASVQENVDLYHTVTSLDKMLSVNYQQSIEFLNLNSPYTTYFLVDGQKLRTSRLIDREEFCRIKLCEKSICRPCEIDMDFVLKENGQPRDIISLIVTVEDVNEFRPQFLDLVRNGNEIQLNISEGVPVGHVLPIPSATDKDGEDDELVYWLEKTSKVPFELVSFGSNQIALNVTGPLDRETRDAYELQLTASDRGNLTSTVTIRISINDINDHVPIFDQQQPYVVNISENILPSLNRSLIRIQASDNDSGENGHVKYKFSPQVSESIRQTFRLDDETGELFLLRKVDYEQIKDYRIQVTAQDCGPVSVPVYTLIIVNVEDENDNIPTMNLRVSEYFYLINSTLYISEETPLNTILMHVLVQDFDSGLNGMVQCWIEPLIPKLNITNSLGNMFAIYTGQLFDREQRSNYDIRIIVEDLGTKIRQHTTRDLHLIITDINDSPPKFDQTSYKISIQEEEEISQPLIRFHATDADLDENGEVTYELMSTTMHELFSLNDSTGELFLRKKLDREEQSYYNLTIRARDHGQHPSSLSTNVTLYIDVLDKNEYAPEFEQAIFSFKHIPENLPVNASIGFVRAFDRDQNSITYSILSSDLRIDPSTGEILVRNPLDYDTMPCSNAVVTVRDDGGLNSTSAVEICLEPINEHRPELTAESRLIRVNIQNTSVINLKAFDRDRSPKSHISFSFYNRPSICNQTFAQFSSNGTIHLKSKEICTGIVDIPLMISDNDQYPSAKITNDTVRLVLYTNSITSEQVLAEPSRRLTRKRFQSFRFWTIETLLIIIVAAVITLLILVICLTCCRQRQRQEKERLKQHNRLHVQQSPSPLTNSSQKRLALVTTKDRIGYTESHCLLSDGGLTSDTNNNSPYDKLQKSIKTNGHSDTDNTSSSYNDSCYGSSEMDVYHHQQQQQQQQQSLQQQSGNKSAVVTTETTTTGKILLSSNENYIILCKDSSSGSYDETGPSTPTSSSSSPSSSSPTVNNNSLITTCQPNKRIGTAQQYRTQLKSSTIDQQTKPKKLDFFQNDDEYRKVLNSTTSFNCRNITPLNEYYL